MQIEIQFFGGRGSSSKKASGGVSKSASSEKVAEKEFEKAFDKINEEKNGGSQFVRISDMRDELGWSREKFDNTLVKLRDKGKIHLMEGDVTIMTDREINNSYWEGRDLSRQFPGHFMGTIMWPSKFDEKK